MAARVVGPVADDLSAIDEETRAIVRDGLKDVAAAGRNADLARPAHREESTGSPVPGLPVPQSKLTARYE